MSPLNTDPVTGIDKLLSDLKAVGQTCLINGGILCSLAIVMFVLAGPEIFPSALASYRWHDKPYFKPFSLQSFKVFFQYYMVTVPINEEIVYRGPIWFLAYYRFGFRNKYLTWIMFFVISAYLNYLWADLHAFCLPVFLVGIPAYILVIKTKNIFTSIISHSLSNLSLYVLAQFLMFFKII